MKIFTYPMLPRCRYGISYCTAREIQIGFPMSRCPLPDKAERHLFPREDESSQNCQPSRSVNEMKRFSLSVHLKTISSTAHLSLHEIQVLLSRFKFKLPASAWIILKMGIGIPMLLIKISKTRTQGCPKIVEFIWRCYQFLE